MGKLVIVATSEVLDFWLPMMSLTGSDDRAMLAPVHRIHLPTTPLSISDQHSGCPLVAAVPLHLSNSMGHCACLHHLTIQSDEPPTTFILFLTAKHEN